MREIKDENLIETYYEKLLLHIKKSSCYITRCAVWEIAKKVVHDTENQYIKRVSHAFLHAQPENQFRQDSWYCQTFFVTCSAA